MQTQVPLEVQLMVVEWVYRSSQHGTIDYPTLRACALVCRSWTPVAQRLLFRRVPVPKPYAEVYDIPKITIDRLLRTLRAAPYLAAHVRSLICNSAAESNADAEQDSDFGDGDVAVLALCTDVASIIFLESVSPALVSHLPTLSVRPVFIYVFGETSLVNRVIDIWPSVRVLDVDGWHAGSISLHVPSAIQALSCYTPVLTWNYWSGSGPAPPVPSLHDLHLRLIDSRLKADMDGVPSSVLAQVRTLRLAGPSAYAPTPAVLEQMVALESLVIDDLPLKENFALPRSLRHFGYHSEDFVWEREWRVQALLDVVRARPQLKLFTATRCSSKALLKRFESMCRELGMEFLVFPEPACFPHPRNVDWV